MYVRTFGQSRDNQTNRGWPYSMSMGHEARVGALLMRFYFTNQLPLIAHQIGLIISIKRILNWFKILYPSP